MENDKKEKGLYVSTDENGALKMPEGWRDIDDEIFKRLFYLEAMVGKLKIADKSNVKILNGHEEMIKIVNNRIDLLRDQSFDRLDDVYYHVFPDRLKQDVTVGKQIAALKSKRGPDAKPKK